MSHYAGRIPTPPRIPTEAEQKLILKVTGEHTRGFRDHLIIAMALGTEQSAFVAGSSRLPAGEQPSLHQAFDLVADARRPVLLGLRRERERQRDGQRRARKPPRAGGRQGRRRGRSSRRPPSPYTAGLA
jgi:hypothetical protein